jgi:hypothetical protein
MLLSNVHGTISIEDDFTAAVASKSGVELARLPIPTNKIAATEFVLRWLGGGELGCTGKMFVEKYMTAAK